MQVALLDRLSQVCSDGLCVVQGAVEQMPDKLMQRFVHVLWAWSPVVQKVYKWMNFRFTSLIPSRVPASISSGFEEDFYTDVIIYGMWTRTFAYQDSATFKAVRYSTFIRNLFLWVILIFFLCCVCLPVIVNHQTEGTLLSSRDTTRLISSHWLLSKK